MCIYVFVYVRKHVYEDRTDEDDSAHCDYPER